MLEIVDVTNPAAPVHKGTILDGGDTKLNNPFNVYVSGNYAYVASASSHALEIVDVTDPISPKHKAYIKDGTDGALLYDDRGVYVSGNYAYVTSYMSNALEIVDVGTIDGTGISVSSTTQITGTFDLTDKIAGLYNVVVTNVGGYFATLASGFQVWGDPSPTFTSISPSSGSTNGGTTVTITGTNFTSGGSFGVTIGGVAATSVTRDSATQISAATPAGTAGSCNVVITNNDGQTVTGTDEYTYVGPTPTSSGGTTPSGGPNTNIGVGASTNLKAGDTTSFKFKDKGAVYELSVKVKYDTPKLMVTVTEKNTCPSSICSPETVVYEYEDVKSYSVDPSDISGGIFDFKVPKSWLVSKGYTKSDVVIMHYVDEVWQNLPTELVSEDNGYYYYSAVTPSFSWFAIAIGEGETILPA